MPPPGLPGTEHWPGFGATCLSDTVFNQVRTMAIRNLSLMKKQLNRPSFIANLNIEHTVY